MHACPCCGYRTFAAPPPGTRRHCPVCWWFDIALEATVDFWSLWEGQVSFERTGAYYPAYRNRVRSPAPDEARDPAWRIDAEPERRRASLYDTAERSIRSAFATVSPEGRVTLGHAYRTEYPGRAPMWRWDDLDQHWSEIPDQVLEMCSRVSSIFYFRSFEGFRYYLPAYLMMDLRGVDDSGLYEVTRRQVSGRGDETAHPEDILTPEQCAAVDAYLAYVAEFGTAATRALAQQHRVHYAAKAARTVGGPVPTL